MDAMTSMHEGLSTPKERQSVSRNFLNSRNGFLIDPHRNLLFSAFPKARNMYVTFNLARSSFLKFGQTLIGTLKNRQYKSSFNIL